MRTELLAVADPGELAELAESFVGRFEAPAVVGRPETGVVMMQVREPVCAERFFLGEVVVSRAEVLWRDATGWAMRLGSDRAAVLSAALCDAAAEVDDDAAAEVAALCVATRARRRAADAAEWTLLLSTRVEFEELA